MYFTWSVTPLFQFFGIRPFQIMFMASYPLNARQAVFNEATGKPLYPASSHQTNLQT
jgi:hypothetical protein